MKDKSFYFKWGSFLLGLFIGFFGVLIALFSRDERRDKIYSSIVGCCIGFLLTMLLTKYYLNR